MFNQPGSNYTPFVEYVAPLLVREERLVEKQNRRSETRGLAATLTLAQWLETLRRYDWRCAFCRGRYEAMTRLVPLREGGGSTVENCAPSCKVCSEARGRLMFRAQQVAQDHERSDEVEQHAHDRQDLDH